LEDQPTQGWFYKWILGIVIPLGLVAYGVSAIISRRADYGTNISMELHGVNAIAYGIALISAAVFMHCHYFWGNIYDQVWFAVLGKILSACGFIAGLAVLIVRIGLWGKG
jgi:hypothetical protein